MARAKLRVAARERCETSRAKRPAHLRDPLLGIALLNDVGASPAGVSRKDEARHGLRVQQKLDVLLGLRAEDDTSTANAVQASFFGLRSPEGIRAEQMAVVVLCQALWRRERGGHTCFCHRCSKFVSTSNATGPSKRQCTSCHGSRGPARSLQSSVMFRLQAPSGCRKA